MNRHTVIALVLTLVLATLFYVTLTAFIRGFNSFLAIVFLCVPLLFLTAYYCWVLANIRSWQTRVILVVILAAVISFAHYYSTYTGTPRRYIDVRAN